jgi:hypothetical protein
MPALFDDGFHSERLECALNFYKNENINNDRRSVYIIDEFFLLQNGRVGSPPPSLARAQIVRFPIRYNRTNLLDNLYGWRAVYFCREMFRTFEFDKVIFVESDFLVRSARMWEWIDGISDGWQTVFCPKYRFAESAFQVITPCREFMEFTAGDFRQYNGRVMEETLPFTHVNRDLVGDRYSESGIEGIPEGADFVAQTSLDTLRSL